MTLKQITMALGGAPMATSDQAEVRTVAGASQFSTLQQNQTGEISPDSQGEIDGYHNFQHHEKSSSPYIASYNQSKREG